MKRTIVLITLCLCSLHCYCWGFFGHQRINYYAVFLLPPEMLRFYKANIAFLTEHATDPDKWRYAVAEEAPRHYIDIDHYGKAPYDSLPRNWKEAVARYSEDSLNKHGIVPWWVQTMLNRLTKAFRDTDEVKILRYSAEIGHYIADAHVPLHASSNHNGQRTNQKGIHGFWESRIPELLADTEWDFFIAPAMYIRDPGKFIWQRVLESAAAADTVLRYEKELSRKFPPDRKYAYETRNGVLIRQYSAAYSRRYDQLLRGMIERRMRQSVFAVASFWYTAWVNAGQPDLGKLRHRPFTAEEEREWEALSKAWQEHGANDAEMHVP